MAYIITRVSYCKKESDFFCARSLYDLCIPNVLPVFCKYSFGLYKYVVVNCCNPTRVLSGISRWLYRVKIDTQNKNHTHIK
jgi:hypothetical protein